MQKKLVIYLLSYNRPEYIGEALDSILSQDYKDFDLIISENSTNDKVKRLLETHPDYKNIKTIKRIPSLPSLQHFNTVLKEVQSYEYAMLFHDDDILMPDAITQMMRQFDLNPSCIAVACNATVIKTTVKTDSLLSPYIKDNLIISSQNQLIKRYVFKRLSHTAFPSYIYKTSVIGESQLDPKDGGRHSDVSFLVKLVKKGSFFWLAKPYMYTRLHSENDSAVVDLNHIAKLSLFFLKTSPHLAIHVAFYFAKKVAKKIKIGLGI